MSMRKRGVKVVWYWQKCWCWPALSLTLVSTSSSVLPCQEPEQIVHLTRCKQATPTELNCELLSTKKSKPTFSSISWPFPSSSESFLSDSLRFALAFEYLLITTFVIAFNHYVIIKTICTQFCHHFSYFGLCGYWGFCVFADLIFLRLVAPMGRILCQLVLFEQQHQTPLLRNLSPFLKI